VERDEKSGLPVGDDLATPPDVGGDHRQAAGRRLHGGSGKSLTIGGQHEEVETGVDVLHVVPATGEDDAAAATGSGQLLGSDGIGLVRIGFSHHHEDDVGVRAAQLLGGRKELMEALLPDQARHRPDHHGVDVDTQVSPGPSASMLVCLWTEALKVDAVAKQHQLVARHTQTRQHAEVIGVLDQFGSRAQRRHPFQGIHHRPTR